ncbi:hypothetical protein FE772_14490 [Lysobacter enzymogenes]|nr:hypothetical protein FE772_14490 [Lysobacter enzymogenes]
MRCAVAWETSLCALGGIGAGVGAGAGAGAGVGVGGAVHCPLSTVHCPLSTVRRPASGVGRRASGVGRRASGVGRRASGVGCRDVDGNAKSKWIPAFAGMTDRRLRLHVPSFRRKPESILTSPPASRAEPAAALTSRASHA